MNQVNPDILCLQETKVMDDSFPVEPFEKLGYSVEVYGQKSYNGVAIISKIKAENVKKGFFGCVNSSQNIEIFLEQKRLISADINGIKFINVYVWIRIRKTVKSFFYIFRFYFRNNSNTIV